MCVSGRKWAGHIPDLDFKIGDVRHEVDFPLGGNPLENYHALLVLQKLRDQDYKRLCHGKDLLLHVPGKSVE